MSNVTMNDANLLCIRFDFGLPLEDIFPTNSIHPRLEKLFLQTYLLVKNSSLPIYKIINTDISICEVLKLKEELLHGNLRYQTNVLPTSYFWLLRHFLGLLPLPLFPKFTDCQPYNWEYLSVKCRQKKYKDILGSDISWWIHKLPKANILLIYMLVNFFRRISLKCTSTKKMDWKNIKALMLFFVPALFMRPFRPGFIRNADSLYYPLMSFIILNWNHIKRETRPFFEFKHNLSLIVEKQYIDSSCQTSLWLLNRKEKSNTTDKVSFVAEEIKSSTPQKASELIQDVVEKPEVKNDSSEKKENIFESHFDTIHEEIKTDEIRSKSQCIIYKISKKKSLTPKIVRKKLTKANRSFIDAISKINVRIKLSKVEMATNSDSQKYNLLRDVDIKKTESLHANHSVKEARSIKYEKLKTL